MDYLAIMRIIGPKEPLRMPKLLYFAVRKRKPQTMIRLKEGFSGSRGIVLPPYVKASIPNDPLLSALHVTDIGYYPEAHFHYVERTQGIAEFVFIYCVEGEGNFTVGSSTYTVHANQYFVLPARQPHRYAADDQHPWTIYWIHFGGQLAQHYVLPGLAPRDIMPEKGSRISTRTNTFEEIFQTLHQGFDLEHLRYASCLFHFYLGTLRYIDQYRSSPRATAEEEVDQVISAALHYMQENLEKRLTLPEIAEFVGYSVSHFSHIFLSRMGQSPLSYLNKLKIDEAAHLLTTTDMKVNQICFKVGFDDPYYFSRLFSKAKGMSPRQYRG